MESNLGNVTRNSKEKSEEIAPFEKDTDVDSGGESSIKDSFKGFLQIILFCIGILCIIVGFFDWMLSGWYGDTPILAIAFFALSFLSFSLCYFLRMNNEKQKEIDSGIKLILLLFCIVVVWFFKNL